MKAAEIIITIKTKTHRLIISDFPLFKRLKNINYFVFKYFNWQEKSTPYMWGMPRNIKNNLR